MIIGQQVRFVKLQFPPRQWAEKLNIEPYACRYYPGIGGVDLCERQLASYKPRLRARKMVVEYISSNIPNLSVVAAHAFYNHIHPSKNGSPWLADNSGRNTSKLSVKFPGFDCEVPTPSAVRHDWINHFLVPCKQGWYLFAPKTRGLCARSARKDRTEQFQEKYNKSDFAEKRAKPMLVVFLIFFPSLLLFWQ